MIDEVDAFLEKRRDATRDLPDAGELARRLVQIEVVGVARGHQREVIPALLPGSDVVGHAG